MELKVVIDKKFAFMILGAILILAGAIYGYAQPEIFGHDWNEIDNRPAGLDDGDDNTNAETICVNNQFLDGDGDCKTAANIIDEVVDCIIEDVWYGWQYNQWPSCPTGFTLRTSGSADTGPNILNYILCVKKSC